jgi:hypothetical protein
MKKIMLALLGATTMLSAGVAQADTAVHRKVIVHKTIHRAPPHHRWHHPVRHRHVVVHRKVVNHHDDHRP